MSSRNGGSILNRIITVADLATLAVLSERHVRRLTKSGVIELAKDKRRQPIRGRYVLGESISRLFEYQRNMASANPDDARFKAARAPREEIDAKSAGIDYAAKIGRLIPRDFAEAAHIEMLSHVRQSMLALPSNLMHSLRGKTDPHEINHILTEGVYAVLHRACDTFPRDVPGFSNGQK